MNLFLTVLEIVAPVFLLGLIGFVWIKLGFEYRLEFVTRLSMTLAVPCLIFVALMNADISPAALAEISLVSVVAYGVVTLVCFLLIAIFRIEVRTYAAPLIFGNTGNLGLPLALFAFGEQGLSYAVVIFAIMGIYSFTFGVWLVSGGGSPWKIFKEPLVGATILGALFLWNGWQTPLFLTNTLDLIGQLAIPLMLITLGVAVARLEIRAFGKSFVLVALKAIICAAIGWFVGRWFGLSPIPLAVLTLQVATPVAVTSYLLAEKYGADGDAVAGLVVVSTLLSVIYIPLILAFVI